MSPRAMKHLEGFDAVRADEHGRTIAAFVETHEPLIKHMIGHAVDLRLAVLVAPGSVVAKALATKGDNFDPKVAQSPCCVLMLPVAGLRALVRDSGVGSIDDEVNAAMLRVNDAPGRILMVVIAPYEGNWRVGASIVSLDRGGGAPVHQGVKGGDA